MVGEVVFTEAAQHLAEQFHLRRVTLFGSQARGTGDDRSDLGLLVICEVADNRRARMVAMDRCLWDLPIARDIIVLTPEEFERDRHIPAPSQNRNSRSRRRFLCKCSRIATKIF